MNNRGTMFIDLDGTIVKHNYEAGCAQDKFLPGAIDKLIEWSDLYDLVITTARSERECEHVRVSLMMKKIFIKQWIYNLNTGCRILINDEKDEHIKARAIRIKRDEGLLGISV